MEEFIKENESEFLEWLEMNAKYENAEKTLKERVNKIKKDIELRNMAIGDNPYKIIESNEKRINEIKLIITNFNMQEHTNELKEEFQEDSYSKQIQNFNNSIDKEKFKIEKAKLIAEKEKLEDENKKIIKRCKENPLAAKEIEDIKQGKIVNDEFKQKIEEKEKNLKSKLKLLIEEEAKNVNENIKNKQDVLSKIENTRKDLVEKLQNEINEKNKVIETISKQQFDIERLNEIKEQTIIRLNKEIEEIKKEINSQIKDMYDIKKLNEEELNENKLRLSTLIGLNDGLKNKGFKNYIIEDLKIKKEQNINETTEQKNEKQEENLEKPKMIKIKVKKVVEEPGWGKDKHGNTIIKNYTTVTIEEIEIPEGGELPEGYEEITDADLKENNKNFIQKMKEKISKLITKTKLEFNRRKKVKDFELNINYNDSSEENELKNRIHVDVNPVSSNNIQKHNEKNTIEQDKVV